MPSRGQPPLARPWQRLLEREGELRAIDQALDAARASHGAFVAVEGIPGVGKTALLASAGKRAEQAGMLVLHARGGQLEREFSFGVTRQLFELLLLRAAPSERGELLDGAAASAAALVGAEGPAVSDGGAWTTVDAAFRAVHGLFWLAANIAAATPLVLIVDDLQWCDAGSLRWLAYLGRRLEGMALVVVVGMHPGEPSAAELLVAATADAHVLRPAPLSPAAVELLVGDRLAADPDDDFCSTCHAMTGGNPLLVRELLTALAEEHVVPAAEACARVRQIGSRAITRIVRGRLARLAPEARALARAVAVLGDNVDIGRASTLAGLDDDRAAVAATALGHSGLLRLDASLAFAHPLERGAVYEAIAPLERESVHAHAARMLAGEHARVQQIAAHLLHCPSQHEPFALAVLRDAARAARAQGAPDAAVAYLRRALCEPLGRGDRAEILLELGLAEKLVDLTAAVEHLREARSLLDGDERRAQAGLQLARTLFLVGLPGQAVAALDEAIALLAPGRGELRKRLQAEVLVVTMSRPELHPIAQRELERIELGCAEDGVGARMLLAMTAYHDARCGRGRDGCADRAQRALADGRLLDEEASGAFVYACRVLVVADRYRAAATAYERALERARERGSITLFALAMAFRGSLGIHRGVLADAEADARAALDAARVGGATTALPFSLTYLALALIEQGELEGAAASLERFAQEVQHFGDMPFFLLVSGRLRRAQGDAEGALAAALEAAKGNSAIDQRNPALAPWRSEAALARLELEDRDAARELAAEEVRLARAWGAPSTLGRSLRVAGLVEGGGRGLELLREALKVLARSPARLERAETLVELGAAVRRSGHRSDARTLLGRGLDLADTCGAHPLGERARGELRVAGARPRRARVGGVQALTPSEQRVAAMAATGMTNRVIAQSLFVTAKTIEVHLSSAYRKLGIGSRTQLSQALARPADNRRNGPSGASSEAAAGSD